MENKEKIFVPMPKIVKNS